MSIQIYSLSMCIHFFLKNQSFDHNKHKSPDIVAYVYLMHSESAQYRRKLFLLRLLLNKNN